MSWYIIVLESTDGYESYYAGTFCVQSDKVTKVKDMARTRLGLSEKEWNDEISIVALYSCGEHEPENLILP